MGTLVVELADEAVEFPLVGGQHQALVLQALDIGPSRVAEHHHEDMDLGRSALEPDLDKKLASDLGMSVSEVLREAALGTKIRRPRKQLPSLDRQTLAQLTGQLGKVLAERNEWGRVPSHLELRGYQLAKGNRHDFVVLDPAGGAHSPARRLGIRAAELRAKTQDLAEIELPPIEGFRKELALISRMEESAHADATLDPALPTPGIKP